MHWRFKESDSHLAIDLCQAMPSALKKDGSIVFKPTRNGKYIGNCVNCEGLPVAQRISARIKGVADD